MRTLNFIILLFLIPLSSTLTASERQYPYYASVAVTETDVRSGPGIEFYPTSQLWLGDKVEVYYETEEWCAIRPPIGSFSWISARYVDLGTNNIGKVVADGLASRVGSENTKLCDTVQVKLKKGEKVFVLDRVETPENIASPLWFKIVPPSGEFRWVSRNALMFPALTQTSRQISPKRSIVQVAYENGEGNVKSGEIGEIDKPEPIIPPPTRPTSPVKLPTPQLTTPQLPTPQLTTIPANESSASKKTIADLPSLASKLASSQPDQNQLIPSPKEPDPFQKAFEELKEETRIVLTRPTEDWVFDTLIHRGAELYEIAPTDSDLEKVYHLVETLRRTQTVRQEIAMRRQFRGSPLLTPPLSATPYPATSHSLNTSVNTSLNTSVNTTTPNYTSSSLYTASSSSSGSSLNSGAPAPMNPATSQQIPQTQQSVAQTPQSVAQTQSTSKIATAIKTSGAARLLNGKTEEFDLAGKLGEFQPLPKGHPPYAIVDEQEQIICLVSPATGVNLKPYLGKTVGINGILGFFEKPGQPNRRHILAREVEIIKAQ
jgi:hypothetical protein